LFIFAPCSVLNVLPKIQKKTITSKFFNMIDKDFTFATYYRNVGDSRDDAFFCQEYESLTKAERDCIRNFQDDPNLYGDYIIAMHTSQGGYVDLISVAKTDGVITERALI